MDFVISRRCHVGRQLGDCPVESCCDAPSCSVKPLCCARYAVDVKSYTAAGSKSLLLNTAVFAIPLIRRSALFDRDDIAAKRGAPHIAHLVAVKAACAMLRHIPAFVRKL